MSSFWACLNKNVPTTMPAVGILECFFGGEMADTNHGRRQGVAKEALTPRPPPPALQWVCPPPDKILPMPTTPTARAYKARP